eukprot:581510-Rhodomonas_salina.2
MQRSQTRRLRLPAAGGALRSHLPVVRAYRTSPLAVALWWLLFRLCGADASAVAGSASTEWSTRSLDGAVAARRG